jgi:lysyl-tRNA synthetase class 2
MISKSEQRLIDERLAKLKALRELGVDPYPSQARRTHTAKSVHDDFSKLETSKQSVTVAGRIRALRRMGKAAFVVIEDASGRIQVLAKEDALAKAYQLVKLCELGDFVQVSGPVFKTKTEEQSIAAQEFIVLTKALRSLPDKFHGLKDQELRFRNRELDLITNPEVRTLFERRALTLRYIRDFLDSQGFLEVETPILQALAGGTEAKPFVTHHEALDIDLFLRIAPELYLKRLIVGGFEKVYELGKIFRNEGVSPQHLQEFTMLEFYWAYASYHDLIPLSEQMISTVLQKAFGSYKFTYGKHTLDFKTPWPRIDYYESIQKACGIDLTKESDEQRLRRAITSAKLDVHLEPHMGYGRMIDNLFKAVVRPKIIQPTHVVGYPLATSPLAKKDSKRAGRVERYQVVVAGFELVNAYSELNDPGDQRQRFEAQAKLRQAGDEEAHVMDQDFVKALEYGMPPTAGFGMGIDRLLALASNANNIREVVFFPTMRPAGA